MTEPRTHSRIYLGLALAISVTAFWGFAYTYFIPVVAGAHPQVSPAVHVHGWSFFLWFLLLPLQAFLMATGRRRTHITLRGASVLPAAIFRIIVGLTGFYWLATPGWVMPAAFFLPAVFIVIGMAYDRVAKKFVHRAYLVGLPVLLVVHGLGIVMAGTAAGEAASRVMALFARVFGGLY